ncbi:uncharacterized protein [Euphorbia lathyris]|uniref:uncharacterized protein n=1 Tax=Euphorbia lathyris TaxID=212925 RepID=UPI0033138444
MGTKVQHKMYLPGYYPMRDLNNGIGNGSWPSHHEDKTFVQYYGMFSAQPTIDGYVGYEKEQLRQTILKHEMIFRQQLHELHRLYKIQADMMNEVRSKEPHNYLKTNGTSQSRFFAIPSSEDKNRWHDSSLPPVALTNHIPSSALGADSIQSQLSSMKLKTMESGCGNIHKGSRSNEYDFVESKCKKLQRRLFDLELPADECVIDEEEGQGASGGSGVESCPPNRNCEKNSNISLQSGAYSICNGDALSSCVNLKRNTGFADLNEPVLFEEASGTASVDILGNITCSTENMQRRDLSASSCSGILAKETSQSPSKEKDGVGVSNLRLENGNGKGGWPPYTFNPGQTAENRSSQDGGLHCEYLPAICESSQIGSQKADKPDQNRREQSTRKTIFGLEICETNHDASFIAKGTCTLQPIIPKSNVDNSESPSISSWKTHPASWRQNLTSVQGSSSISTFPKSDNGSGMHHSESAWDRLAELCHQNSLYTVSQLDSKESQGFHGSVLSFGCPNGVSDSNSASGQAPQHSPAINLRSSGWLKNLKSVDEANAVFPKSSQNEAISDSKRVFVDDLKKEENLKGGLSWLRNSSLCNGKHSKERDGCHHANLDFLQNNSLQYSTKAEMTNSASQNLIQDSSLLKNSHTCDAEDRRAEEVDGLSNRKILEVPIFEKQMPKDLSSASSTSKSSVSEVEVNGVNSVKRGLLLTDLNDDPIPSDEGEVQHLKSLATEEVSRVCKAKLRDCIDLNVSMIEEEAELNHFSSTPKTKIALDINLEAPVLETDMDTSPDEFIETKLKEPFDALKDESGEGFMRVAADALIAISSSVIHSQDDATHPDVEASLCDSLQWFAEIISSHEVDLRNDVQSVSAGKGSRDSDDSIPNGIDYFEYMTLNLTETKLEEYHYEAEVVIEYAKEEVALPRRGRRAQARRGRQRKDFQRDVLPGIVSLSRIDVTEDLQTIEGLIRATGGNWQSSLSQKNSLRGKGRGGRKRLSASTPSPPITTISPSQPQPQQQPKCGELGLEETRLTGWGKRTRRPPRQRCLINHPSFPLQ